MGPLSLGAILPSIVMAILIEILMEPPIPRNSALCSAPMARASIIISAKNEAARIEACLQSLLQQKCSFSFEILVIDNQSSDSTTALVKKFARRHRGKIFLYSQKKPGSPACRNLGARKAKGEFLLFTDADCTFHNKWVEEMVAGFSSTLPVGAVGGLTLSKFSKTPSMVEKYLDQKFAFWEEDRVSDFPAFLPWAPTCNLAVKKEIFLALSGFDENWKTAAYDVDFCWRLELCGFVVSYAPKAMVNHERRGTLPALFRQRENYAYYNSALLDTYEKSLGFSKLGTQWERAQARARYLLSLAKKTKNPREIAFRSLDALSLFAQVGGKTRAKISYPKGSQKLDPSRSGICAALESKLENPYRHLHREGWTYWEHKIKGEKNPDLVLYHPRTAQRLKLNASARKVLEVKSRSGQAEDAARGIHKKKHSGLLHEIDETTNELRSLGLLP